MRAMSVFLSIILFFSPFLIAKPRHEKHGIYGNRWTIYKVFENQKLHSCCLMGVPTKASPQSESPYVLLTVPYRTGPLTLSLFMGQPLKAQRKVKVSFATQELFLHPAGTQNDTAWPEDVDTQEQMIEASIRDLNMEVTAQGQKGEIHCQYDLQGFGDGYTATLKACHRSASERYGSVKKKPNSIENHKKREPNKASVPMKTKVTPGKARQGKKKRCQPDAFNRTISLALGAK